ncbi:TPA: hypothetical protein ACXE8V_002104 [Pluralibacter gergoviae]
MMRRNALFRTFQRIIFLFLQNVSPYQKQCGELPATMRAIHLIALPVHFKTFFKVVSAYKGTAPPP